MAEAGSFADRVKQQADIVRVIGEYVRLKKSGQNFSGLCPFHQEKTPSFSVSAVKQMYYCFGCGKGGDVFQFVMELEKAPFPEAVRTVAEKCGIAIPKPRERSPEERKENQQRSGLVDMHREAAAFFARHLLQTPEGKVAYAYLEDRGLDRESMTHFGLGFAPSAGDALARFLKQKYPDNILEVCGLVGRDQSGRFYDRFRRRIMFPIANEAGKVIAFGGRAMGDDMPKYMNSPETPIYSKSGVLYHLDRAKQTIRQNEIAVLVEGYMDAIAVARAGVTNVVAACGTSLAEQQVKLLRKCFSAEGIPRVVVNYDPDMAGQVATDRSIRVLLAIGFDIKVLVLPSGNDPDKFIRAYGVPAYMERLKGAKSYAEYLGEKIRGTDLSTPDRKLAALNFVLPFLQLMPNKILRTEWATLFSHSAQIQEPVLREALRRAADERRSEVKAKTELLVPAVKRAERQLIRMLFEAVEFREKLAHEIASADLHRGLETRNIFEGLVVAIASGQKLDAAAVAATLDDKDRRLFFEILFETLPEGTWEDAESCLGFLRHRPVAQELTDLQRQIEANPAAEELKRLVIRRMELLRLLSREREPEPGKILPDQ
jgi:DNA primase